MDDHQEDTAETAGQFHIQMPRPTYWPISVGWGVALICFGFVTSIWFSVVGALFFVGGILGWIKELIDG